MAEGRVLERRDAAALARFLDEPREQFGTRVTVAERDGNGKVIGAESQHAAAPARPPARAHDAKEDAEAVRRLVDPTRGRPSRGR